jgi:hypothetical protein
MKLLARIGITLMAFSLIGCTSVTPEELASFKTKLAIVREMHNKCASDPAACCNGLGEAERAMETIITACED